MRRRFLLDGGWISSKYATSPALAIALVFNYVFTGYLVGVKDPVFGFEPHFYDLWASSLYGIAVVLVGLLLKRKDWSAATKNVATWAIGGIFGATLQFFVLLLVTGDTYIGEWLVAAPTALLSVFAACYVYTLLIASLIEGVGRTRVLRSTLSKLHNVRAHTAQELDELTATMRQPILGRLTRFAQLLDARLEQGASGVGLASEVFDFVGNDLRPGVTALANQNGAKSIRWAGIRKVEPTLLETKKVSFDEAFGAYGAALVLASFFVPSFWYLFDLPSAVAELLVLGFAVGVWKLVSRVAGTRVANWLLWAFLNGALFFSASLFASPISRTLGGKLEQDLALTTSVISGLVAFGLSAMQSMTVRRARLQVELQRLGEELNQAVATLDARLSMIRKNVEKHFHNTVQSRLVALALRLQGLEQLSSAQVQEFRQDLKAALQAATVDSTVTVAFQDRLKELSDFWTGALTIRWSLGPETLSLLGQDSELADRVMVVLREALTNAAKYSNDGSVQVEFLNRNHRLVVVASNSTKQAFWASNPTGIGTRSIDQASARSSWVLEGDTFTLETEF